MTNYIARLANSLVFKRPSLFGIMILFLLSCQCAFTQGYEVYVSNHPLPGDSITRNQKIYVSAELLAKFLGLPIQSQGDSLIIGKLPEGSATGKITLNGKPFSDAFQVKEKWYVALKPFVEANGGKVVINHDTKIIDVVSGDSPPPHNAMNALKDLLNSGSGNTPTEQDVREDLKDIDRLKSEHADLLNARPDVRNYLDTLGQWNSNAMSVGQQLSLKRAKARAIQDNTQRRKALEQIITWYTDKLLELQGSFNQIRPPKEFLNSHQIASRIADSYSQVRNGLLKMVQLRYAIDKTEDPEEKAELQSKIDAIGPEANQYVEKVAELTIAHIQAQKNDLEKFVHERGAK